MKTRTAAHSWINPHTTDLLSFVFSCEINNLFTKCFKEGRVEGFKVSPWFLKIMKFVKYRIANKCHDFHHCCKWLHQHYSRGCHGQFYLQKQYLTLTTWFWKCYKLLICKRKEPSLKALVIKLTSSYLHITIITVESQSAWDIQSDSLHVKLLDLAPLVVRT